MWTDSHAHLYDLDDKSLQAVLTRAREAGVGHVLNTAVSVATSRAVVRQCAGRPEMSAAIGVSPFDAADIPDSWCDSLTALMDDPAVVAMGEIGVDATKPSCPDLARQTAVFEEQARIAVGRDLPIVIHSRGAERKLCEMCRANGVKKAVFHCFTGALADLRRLLDAGYMVSFSGIITFKNSPLSHCVGFAPLSRMLIETDSPYLAPVPHRGKTNEPGWVGLVGERIAEIKKMDPVDLSETLRENFLNVFGLKTND